MILLTSVCIWHGITTAIKFPENSEQGKILENIALGTLAGLYFLFNLIFVIRIYSVVSTTSIALTILDREILVKPSSLWNILSSLSHNLTDLSVDKCYKSILLGGGGGLLHKNMHKILFGVLFDLCKTQELTKNVISDTFKLLILYWWTSSKFNELVIPCTDKFACFINQFFKRLISLI